MKVKNICKYLVITIAIIGIFKTDIFHKDLTILRFIIGFSYFYSWSVILIFGMIWIINNWDKKL